MKNKIKTVSYNKCIIELKRKVRILDLGAGSGLVSNSLVDKDYTQSIIAYDRTLECMRELNEHPKISKSSDGSVNNLPFETNSFDVIICRYAFHHFEYKEQVIDEIIRTLKPKGLFLYSDPVFPEHCMNIINPLYYMREDNFHGYLGYFDTIEMFNRQELQIILCRPYKYWYESFQKYLKGVDSGFLDNPQAGFSDCLKTKLERSWDHLDQETKKEMGITDSSKKIVYHVVDLAIIKQ